METRFFNGGHCLQLHALVDRRTWKIAPFHAVFLAVRHPERGWVLIDTGYSSHFAEATRRWPFRLYRWVTPVRTTRSTPDILRAAGIDPAEIRDIVITHFHADHIGGLRDFPAARFWFCAEAWSELAGLSPLAQTKGAFLPALVPEDFGVSQKENAPAHANERPRAHPVPLSAFTVHPTLGLPAFDLWGDGAITLVSLPGHAPGHAGVWLDADRGPLLYAADAFWHWRQIDDGIEPMIAARVFIHDRAAYASTVGALRTLAGKGVRVLACHCPRTQEWMRSVSGQSGP